MTENEQQRPLIWLVDSVRSPLASCREAIDSWAEVAYFPPDELPRDWTAPPDAVLFSAEMKGGAEGEAFQELLAATGGIPLIAVARLRSLAQAVAYFRAGVTDYLSLPLDEDDARERVAAAFDRAAALAMRGMMVELEPVDQDPGEVSLTVKPSTAPYSLINDDEDILAKLNPTGVDGISGEDEPIAVDGLPIPSLWEELPCGVMVFDSNANLVFSNNLALGFFGVLSLAELQEALENRRGDFKAYGANQKPLPDNQWPHVLAGRTRTARSAVVSVEKPDRRRSWLRIDCLPHLHDGQITRLGMTIVNLTGELPPLALTDVSGVPEKGRSSKGKARGKKKK